MYKFKNIIILLSITALLITAVYYYGIHIGRYQDKNEVEMSGQAVLREIQDNNFLVTKTIFLSEDIKVEVKYNSGWKDLLWGKTVNMRGLVRADMGVDVDRLSEKDITVDKNEKTILVKMPKAEILDINLDGDLSVETEKGVFEYIKDLFTEDQEEIYNNAKNNIVSKAKEDIEANFILYEEAREQSKGMINLILKSFQPEYIVIFN